METVTVTDLKWLVYLLIAAGIVKAILIVSRFWGLDRKISELETEISKLRRGR